MLNFFFQETILCWEVKICLSRYNLYS